MGARREFPIDADYADGRLETFLRRKLGLPRTLALKAIRKGWIRVDGKRVKIDTRLVNGAVVVVTNPALSLPALDGPPSTRGGHARESVMARGTTAGPARPAAARVAIPPALVERARKSVRRMDARVLVSSKPAGEVVHAGSGHEAGWVDALERATSAGADQGPVAIGRLDRDTSGLLILGRTRAATRALFAALRAGTLSREYVALAHGRLDGNEGVIDLPLAKVTGEDGLERVEPVRGGGGQEARTRWRVLERFPAATLVACRIETGRTHQIRAHLAALGHPIVGDPRYGGTSGAAGALARATGFGRLFLHAGSLDYPDPGTGETVHVEDPLPGDLAAALDRLRAERR